MKKSFSTTAFLSTAALVMLASSASACIFSENNNLTLRNSEDSPTLSSTQLDTSNVETNDNRNGLIGIAVAAMAGLVVAGLVYKVRRAGQDAYIAIAQTPQDALDATSFPRSISSEPLRTPTSEQDTTDSTADKDLTLVG